MAAVVLAREAGRASIRRDSPLTKTADDTGFGRRPHDEHSAEDCTHEEGTAEARSRSVNPDPIQSPWRVCGQSSFKDSDFAFVLSFDTRISCFHVDSRYRLLSDRPRRQDRSGNDETGELDDPLQK